jgi:hypothetical protein
MTDERRDPGRRSRKTAGVSVAKPKQRDRAWDKANKPWSVRLGNTDVPDELAEIADAEGLNVGEITRFFLQDAIARYRAGELRLRKFTRRAGLTLYPDDPEEK